jgi:hypothetical protein
MNLKEIKEKIKPGESAEHPGATGGMKISYEAFQETKIEKFISLRYAVSDDWEIVPVEPKVLTAEEWYKSFYSWEELGISRYDEQSQRIATFNAGHKNGRLERDLELRPAIESMRVAIESDMNFFESGNPFFLNLKNIPPL